MRIRMDQLICAITKILSAAKGRNNYSSGEHSKRVAILAAAMAKHSGFDPQKVFAVAACALLHESSVFMRFRAEHADGQDEVAKKNYCILGQQNMEDLELGVNVTGYVLYHCERADGKGLFGKKDGEFPEGAALIAAANYLDRKFGLQNYGTEDLPGVRCEIERSAGVVFTTMAADALVHVLDEAMLENMREGNTERALGKYMPAYAVELTDVSVQKVAGRTAHLIDQKTGYQNHHSVEMADIAKRMGKYYGYGEEACARLYVAAALHDLAKIMVPAEILEKPGPLTEEEYEVVKKHVAQTINVLDKVEGLEKITSCIENHHERLDGSGYPSQKTSIDLDFSSRLLTCLDIYQAMGEERPYHASRSHKQIMAEMFRMAGNGYIDVEIVHDLDREMGGVKKMRVINRGRKTSETAQTKKYLPVTR